MAAKPPAAAKTPAPARVRPKKQPRRAIGRPAAEGGVGRESLVETTCELLKTMPPNEVTRIGVAREAGVDPSLIKYYFRDRSSLLLAAAERLLDRTGKVMAEASARSGDTAEARLRARISALLDLNDEYPFFHRLILDEVINSSQPEARMLLRGVSQRREAGYRALIEAGEREGTMRFVDPVFLSMAVIGMCEFFVSGRGILREVHGAGFDDAAERVRFREFVIDLVLNGLRAPNGAKAKPKAKAKPLDKAKPAAGAKPKPKGAAAKVS